jgi:hypothetical protein
VTPRNHQLYALVIAPASPPGQASRTYAVNQQQQQQHQHQQHQQHTQLLGQEIIRLVVLRKRVSKGEQAHRLLAA